MHCNQIGLAVEYQKMWKLPEALIDMDEKSLEACRAERQAKYHQLGIPMERIIFIDKREQLEGVWLDLKHELRIGIDFEWNPQRGHSSASLLQATRSYTVSKPTFPIPSWLAGIAAISWICTH